jgi:RIO kinase 1
MASAERPDQDEESGQDWDSFVAEHGELEEMAPDIDWSKLAPDEKSLERDRHKQRESLEKNADKWAWMKERKHQQMFSEIENKLQGALGVGTFDWVDRRVFDQVFDRLTLLSIYKLMKKGIIDTVEWPIARGKEAHVFRGEGVDGPIAVKIFHTSNAVFKNLIQYIEGDPRFEGLKRRHRDLVTIWVRKEHRNLIRLEREGLRVPEPLGVLNNVLVMEYIGDETGPSPKLREIEVTDAESVFTQLVHFLATCWQKARLVHGDFSPYNILWHEDKPLVIDVGQAVALQHPRAQEFLVRDIERLVTWAKANGIETATAEILYDVLNTPPEEILPNEEE